MCRVPIAMGCGRSKENKDNDSDSAAAKQDQDNNDVYQKSGSERGNAKSISPVNGASAKESTTIPQINGNLSTDDDMSKGGSKPPATGGPIQQNAKLTTSQVEFFKMLDEKIEKGDDYTSELSRDL